MRVSLHQNGHISPDTTESERERGKRGHRWKCVRIQTTSASSWVEGVAFSPVSNGGGRLARPREEGNKICNRGENVMKFASMKRWKLARCGRPFFEQVVRACRWLIHQM